MTLRISVFAALALFLLLSGRFTNPALAQEHQSWSRESMQQVMDVYGKFSDAANKKDTAKAIPLGEELCRLDNNPEDRYDLACLYIQAGRPDEAMQKLREAVASAANDPSFLLADSLHEDTDLDPVRSRSDFPALVHLAEQAAWKPVPLEYATGPAKPVAFKRSGADNAYLTELRARYPLDTLVAGARGDMERVQILCTWVHTRWNHVGDAESQPVDPIGLLEAAKKGDNFRCVEYGVTIAGCLSAVGIPARVVSASAMDVATRRSGAGHVFAEAYLRDQKCWVFVDPQSNVVGEVDGKPLNTVEFRQAFSGPYPKVHYDMQLASCFYYFVYGLDWRYPLTARSEGRVLLAPKEAAIPRTFQRIYSASYTLTTHNPADVYGPPPAAR